MKIIVSGKNIEIGAALKQHCEAELNSFIEKHALTALESYVLVSKLGHFFFIDITLHVSHNFTIRAHAEDGDPYRAVNLTLSKIESRINRYKKRLRDKKRHAKEDVVTFAQQYVLNSEAEDTGEDTPIIIAEAPHEIETLSVGEAVMRMDLGNQTVMMFKNPRSGELNVIYRRPDGNIGWIDPTQKS